MKRYKQPHRIKKSSSTLYSESYYRHVHERSHDVPIITGDLKESDFTYSDSCDKDAHDMLPLKHAQQERKPEMGITGCYSWDNNRKVWVTTGKFKKNETKYVQPAWVEQTKDLNDDQLIDKFNSEKPSIFEELGLCFVESTVKTTSDEPITQKIPIVEIEKVLKEYSGNQKECPELAKVKKSNWMEYFKHSNTYFKYIGRHESSFWKTQKAFADSGELIDIPVDVIIKITAPITCEGKVQCLVGKQAIPAAIYMSPWSVDEWDWIPLVHAENSLNQKAK